MPNLGVSLLIFTILLSTAHAQSLRLVADDRVKSSPAVEQHEATQNASSPDDEYRIGPQDLIEVRVYANDGLTREVRVNSRGVISLPLIGPIPVGGLTSQEAEALVTAKYEKDFLREPQVSVFIKEFTSQRITIEGAVNKPGMYPIRGQTTLLRGIAIAGGQGSLAEMSEVMIFRNESGERKAHKFDVIKIRAGEVEDPLLANDDVVVVQRSKSRVVFKDSLFRDFLDAINPFNVLKP